MTNAQAIEVLNKHTACRNTAKCEMNCESCNYNVTCEEVNQALEIAKLAIYKDEYRKESIKEI